MRKASETGDAFDYDKPICVYVGKWSLWQRLSMAWRAFRKPDAYRAAPIIGCAMLDGTVQANVVMTHEDNSKREVSYVLAYRLINDKESAGD
tara:strand:- start:117275 stop:117550 length:276 start_codon:yes stop_codon:yes gene_type:complete